MRHCVRNHGTVLFIARFDCDIINHGIDLHLPKLSIEQPIHDSLHHIQHVNDLEVRVTLNTEAAFKVLLSHCLRRGEILEDLTTVFRALL